MEKVYIVTGGAGFIGSSLIKKIKMEDPNSKFLIIDKADSKLLDKIFNEEFKGLYYYATEDKRMSYMERDLNDFGYPSKDFNDKVESYLNESFGNNIEVSIIHCASPVGVDNHNADLFNDGFNMTQLVVSLIYYLRGEGWNITEINYMSTSEVYGNIKITDKDEIEEFLKTSNYNKFNKYLNINFDRYRGSYVRQKLASEHLLIGLKDIRVNIFRLFNVFGMNQKPEQGIVPKILKKLESVNNEIILIGDGERTYTPINFAVESIYNTIVDKKTNSCNLTNIVRDGYSVDDYNLIDGLLLNYKPLITDSIKYDLYEALNIKYVRDNIDMLFKDNLRFSKNNVKAITIKGKIKYFFEVSYVDEIKMRKVSTITNDLAIKDGIFMIDNMLKGI